MRFVEQRSTKEIAKALSLKETTVDVRIPRGRARRS
ncbi:sigma factor-like helix-turn-helix DNA-binding protein [Flavonifractor plautii]